MIYVKPPHLRSEKESSTPKEKMFSASEVERFMLGFCLRLSQFEVFKECGIVGDASYLPNEHGVVFSLTKDGKKQDVWIKLDE